MSGPIHANPQQQEQLERQLLEEQEQQEQQVVQQLQQQQVWDLAPNQRPLYRRESHLSAMIQQQEDDSRLLAERAQATLPAAQAEQAAAGAPVQTLAPAENTAKQQREEERRDKVARQHVAIGDHISYDMHEQLGEYYKERKAACSSKLEKQLRAHSPAFDALQGFLQQPDKRMSSAEKKRIDAENRALVNGYLSNDAAAHNAALKTCLKQAFTIHLTADMLHTKNLVKNLKELMVIYNRMRSLDELLKDPANYDYCRRTLSRGELALLECHRQVMPALETYLRVILHCKGVELDGSYLKDLGYYRDAIQQQRPAIRGLLDHIGLFDRELQNATTEQMNLAQQRLQADSAERLRSEEYRSLGLTTYANAENAQRLKDLRDLIAASPEKYAAAKPLFDRLYQQFFRGIDALGDTQLKIDGAAYVIARKGDQSAIGKSAAKYLAHQRGVCEPIQQQLDAVSGLIRFLLGQQRELSDESRLLAEREHALDAVQRIEAAYQEQADEALWRSDPQALIDRVQGKLDQLRFGTNTAADLHWTHKDFFNKGLNNDFTPEDCQEVAHQIYEGFAAAETLLPCLKKPLTAPDGTVIQNMNAARTIMLMVKLTYPNTDTDQVSTLMYHLLRITRYYELTAIQNPTPAEQQELAGYTDDQWQIMNDAFRSLLTFQLQTLQRIDQKYGRYLSQLHPEDLISRCGTDFFLILPLQQDINQMLGSAGHLLHPDTNPEDQEYLRRAKHFEGAVGVLLAYYAADTNRQDWRFNPEPEFLATLNQNHPDVQLMLQNEPHIHGPGFNSAEMKAYQEILRRRYKKQPHLLCGRFAPAAKQA